LGVWAACCGLAHAEPVTKFGYITMSDGVKLRYAAVLPDKSGSRFPVAMKYDGYCEGSNPLTCNEGSGDAAKELLAAGYAVVGVQVRGTGCSQGQFDFRAPVEDTDGAAAVEFIERQDWSTGHIGMFGDSFPGITQPGVAALHPKGLDAIAPWQIVDDPYRDVAYPGGLGNGEFGIFWGVYNQPFASAGAAGAGAQAGDPQCGLSAGQQAPVNLGTNIFVSGQQHPYIDSYWKSKTVGDAAAKINVPTLGCTTWQDDEVGSRAAWTLFPKLDPGRTWMIGSNGFHGQCVFSKTMTKELIRFFDRFVKGEQNGYENTPHTQIWHDSTDATDAKPGWVTSGGSWPPAAEPTTLYLGKDAALSATAPAGDEPADDFVFPTASAATENGIAFGQSGQLWKASANPAGAQAYTTPKLAQDVELLGPASVNLWLKSTATDTGVQATITEIRPDGQEVYVDRGWLVASHRKLDVNASTATMPVQTHREADAQPLEPGTPTLMRIEVFPFDYVFRAGSRLRVTIDTPSQTGGWNFQPVAGAGVNSILHDAEHPSEVVFSTVPTSPVENGYPTCDTVLNQPCRPDAFPSSAPGGELQWPRPAAPPVGACTRTTPVKVRMPKARKGDRIVRAKIAINGKTVKRLRGRSLRHHKVVTLRKVPDTAFRVKVTARTKKGKKLRRIRNFGACS
jgi:putative CocE/NonD family hydrolase